MFFSSPLRALEFIILCLFGESIKWLTGYDGALEYVEFYFYITTIDSFHIFHQITLVKSMNGHCSIMEYYRKAHLCSDTRDVDKSGVECRM